MKRIVSIVLICGMLMFMLSGCGVNENSYDDLELIDETAEEYEEDDSMNLNLFDEKLLSYIAENTEGNYMVSPLSFRYALGLLLAGANGETKTELLKALDVKNVDEWTESCEIFNDFVKAFDENLASETEYTKKVYELNGTENAEKKLPFRALRVANSVWKAQYITTDYRKSYKNYISDKYAAEYKEFTADNAVRQINIWASEKTEKMIERILDDKYDASDLAVVLMNALYFKDSWQEPFYEENTVDGEFTTENGKKVKKSFMNQERHFNYYSDNKTQLVVLPMKGNVNMAFVIGDTDNIGEKINKARREKVNVKLPKLDIETSFSNHEFNNFLKENGVKLAFDNEKADFSKMIDYPIYVDDIVQKTKIKLDEEGAEAAAVTTMMMRGATALDEEEKIYEFNADRPFSFYIYTTYKNTTSILFAGEVVE